MTETKKPHRPQGEQPGKFSHSLSLSSDQSLDLLESISEAFYGLDSDWRFIYLNHKAEQLWDRQRETLIGKNIWEEFPQGVNTQAYAEMHRALEQQQVVRFETFSPLLDAWVEAEVYPTRNGLSVYFHDVTERKRAENEVRRLYTAVEQSGNSVVITDLQGNIEYVNPRFTEVTGYTADEVIGKNPRIMKSGETPPEVYQQLWDTIVGGNVWHGEFHNRKKNGDLFWETATISPVKDSEGRIISFLAVKEDITARKQAEEEIRGLAKFPAENPQPVLRIRDDGLVLYANEKGRSLLAEFGSAVGDAAPVSWRDLLAGATANRSPQSMDFQQGDKVWSLVAASVSDMGYVNVYGVEITKRKRVEEALKTSEARYRRLFEAAKDGILILDANSGQVQDVNPFLCELLGYAREDFLGKELWEIGLFRDIVASQQAFRDLQDKGYIRYEDLPLKTGDGRTIAVEFVSNVYLVNDAKVIQCNIRNISQRKQAEEKLRDSERQYHQLIESLHSGVVVHAPDTSIILYNETACKLLGISPDQMLGKTARDLAWNFIRDDGSIMPIEEYPVNRVLVSQKPLVNLDLGIKQSQTADVTRVLVNAFAAFNDNQEIKQIVVTFIDITERRRAEETLAQERNLLRTLIDSLPERIYAKDSEGRFTLKNLANSRQLGATSTDEVIGKTDFDYYPGAIAEKYTADDQAVISSGQALIDREEPFVDADGTRGWMLTTKVPLRDVQGKVIGLVGIGQDITDRKRAEEDLRKLNRTLAVLSHVNQAIVRLRNPAELFEEVCRIAVEQGGFHMAWVGLLDLESQQVNPVASAGVVEDYVDKLAITLRDELRGHGPSASALRTGEHVIVNDIEHDPRMIPWRDDGLKLDYRAAAAFPVKVAAEVRGVFSLYSGTPGFFDAEELDTT